VSCHIGDILTEQAEKNKAATKAYRASARGKANRKAYHASAKGKATQKAFWVALPLAEA
jgi:hypothetical protein